MSEDNAEEDLCTAQELQEQAEANQKQTEETIDYQEKYLRCLADLENTRKRMQKEKQQTVHFAIENSIGEFIPLIDNFENALNFAKNASDEVKNWAAGFQMILSQFRDILHNHGIVAYHSEGNLFDPHNHEAVEIVETNEYPEGTIIEEFAKGYKSKSRVIRPAQVKVAKNLKQESEDKPPIKETNHE